MRNWRILFSVFGLVSICALAWGSENTNHSFSVWNQPKGFFLEATSRCGDFIDATGWKYSNAISANFSDGHRRIAYLFYGDDVMEGVLLDEHSQKSIKPLLAIHPTANAFVALYPVSPRVGLVRISEGGAHERYYHWDLEKNAFFSAITVRRQSLVFLEPLITQAGETLLPEDGGRSLLAFKSDGSLDYKLTFPKASPLTAVFELSDRKLLLVRPNSLQIGMPIRLAQNKIAAFHVIAEIPAPARQKFGAFEAVNSPDGNGFVIAASTGRTTSTLFHYSNNGETLGQIRISGRQLDHFKFLKNTNRLVAVLDTYQAATSLRRWYLDQYSVAGDGKLSKIGRSYGLTKSEVIPKFHDLGNETISLVSRSAGITGIDLFRCGATGIRAAMRYSFGRDFDVDFLENAEPGLSILSARPSQSKHRAPAIYTLKSLNRDLR